MADGTNNNLFCFWVCEIQHPIITDVDAEAVSVLQLFAAGRERITFERQNRPGNPHLHLRLQTRQFLAGKAGNFDLPAHALMPNSFKACRNDCRGWCRRDSKVSVSAMSAEMSSSASIRSSTASRWRGFNDLNAVKKTSAVASMALIHRLSQEMAQVSSRLHFGFSCGNRITSRMLSWPRSIMHRRSMPMPMPPAGGMPCSSATRKSSSSFCGSPPA